MPIYLWKLSKYMVELSNCERDSMTNEAPNIYSLSLDVIL